MGKKTKRSTTEDESSPSSTESSSEDISREETARRRRRRRSQARRHSSKKVRSDSQGKEIMKFLAEVKEEVCKQSKQVAESKEEMYKQLEKLSEEMRKQSKQASEGKEDICKQLEKVKQDNQEMRKQFTQILTDLRKQWDIQTNGSSGYDSDAPRSQSNQVQPPRYRLEFKSEVTDKIEKGQIIDISVALVDGINDQTVKDGPLASATVELVVLNAEFNQHNNQYNWSREDFESSIKKVRERNSAMGVDQSVKSVVSNGRFNLVHGARCHSGSTIFSNSSNKKVRLGVMVVSPTEERVLEGLSNPFFVRGHDRPARQNNVRHNRSNTRRHALVDNGYQEQNGSIPVMQSPSWTNPTPAEGMRLNITGGQPQLPFVGNTTVPSSALNITGGQPQLPFLGTTIMPSMEPSSSLEQHASIQQYHIRHWPMLAQATNNQTGTQFNTSQIALPVHLVWDRPNVEPSKHHWELLEKFMPQCSCQTKFNKCGHIMQDYFGSLTVIPKEVRQSRWKNAFIEPLEPDDSDEQRPQMRTLHKKYRLQFVNEVCKTYYTWDKIKADDRNLLKVSLFDESKTKITSGPLSSASVEVVVLHGDFNVDGQDYWTSDEFNLSVLCPPPGEASSVLGGARTLVLAHGEACVSDAFFQITSLCARSGKFKLGVMLACAQDERVQEGISEPFRVMDNHVKEWHAKDGPTQGFNPAASTLKFPRNSIQLQASIPQHQFSHLKSISSAPAMRILPAMAGIGVLETTTTQPAAGLRRTPSLVTRTAYTSRHKRHHAPMLVPSIPTCWFLQHCFLCQSELTDGMDIYIYRGERAFCSVSCRCRHMIEDYNSVIDSARTTPPDRFRRSRSCYDTASACFFLSSTVRCM